MQNRKSISAIGLSAGMLALSGPALAADYDEAVDGDLASVATGPTIFDVEVGTNSVSGTVGQGAGLDEDFIGFTIEAGELLTAVTITDFTLVPGNTSTGFRLYADLGAGYEQVSAGTIDNSSAGVNYLTVWNLSFVGGSFPLGPGDYGIVLAEFTADQAYAFDITVAVPAPATAGVLGLGGLCLARRRRRDA